MPRLLHAITSSLLVLGAAASATAEPDSPARSAPKPLPPAAPRSGVVPGAAPAPPRVGPAITPSAPAAPTDAPPEVDPEQLAAAVLRLDAPLFADREAAMLRLIQAGAPAVEPVVDLLERHANLETTMRAIYVLRSLALGGDEAAENAAMDALTQVAQRPQSSVTRHAETALASIGDTRQARTITDLQKLGARFGAAVNPFGIQVDDEVSEVEIGADWKGEEKDLRRLRWAGDIHRVTFTGPKVTDGWLKAIAGLHNLTDVKVKRGQVTDAGVAHLRDLPRLQRLFLWYMPLTDAAVDDLLAIKTLQHLEIYGADMTPDGVERLRKGMPLAKLDYRRGGFLGVGGNEHLLGYQIFHIQENSAAGKAGIEVEDILVRFEDHPIRTFDELTGRIALHRAGETVRLTMLRGDVRIRTLETEHAAGDQFGITTRPHPLGLELTEFDDRSLANSAGLKKGDVLVAYKGARTTSQEQLKKLFDANQPGEQPELQIVRAPEMRSLQVTLGERD